MNETQNWVVSKKKCGLKFLRVFRIIENESNYDLSKENEFVQVRNYSLQNSKVTLFLVTWCERADSAPRN